MIELPVGLDAYLPMYLKDAWFAKSSCVKKTTNA